MRDHFFISETDGALYDTRAADWNKSPLRPIYSRHFPRINSAAEFKASLRAGASTDLGGYPLYFVTSDGAALSFDSARSNAREIIGALNSGDRRGGWHVFALEINYEDLDLFCAHSGDKIPAAYDGDE